MKYKTIFYGSTASYLCTGLTMLINFIMVPVFLDFLGQEAYGLWLVALAIVGYVSFPTNSMTPLIQNHIAGEISKDNDRDIISAVATGFYGFLAIGVVACLIVYFILFGAGVMQFVMVPSPDLQKDVASVMIITIAFCLIRLPMAVFSSTLTGMNLLHKVQLILLASTIVQFLFIYSALSAGGGLIELAFVYSLTALLFGVSSFIYLKTKIPNISLSPGNFDRNLMKTWLVPSTYWVILGFGSLLVVSLDALIISAVLDVKFLALYMIAMKICDVSIATLSTITTALRPSFTSVFSDKDIVGLSKLYTFGLKTSVFLGLWIFFVLVSVGPNFVIEWVGEDNYVGDQVFYLMALYMLVNILIVPSDSLLMGTNHQKSYGVMMIIEGILNVSLSVWWIQMWGLAGVIGATVVARCCTNGWYCLFKAFRITDYSVSKIFVEILRPMLPSLLLTTLTAYLLLFATLVGWEKIIIHTFGLTCVYVFSYFFFAVKKESRDKLFTILFVKSYNRR